jgi:hypothetical protein
MTVILNLFCCPHFRMVYFCLHCSVVCGTGSSVKKHFSDNDGNCDGGRGSLLLLFSLT